MNAKTLALVFVLSGCSSSTSDQTTPYANNGASTKKAYIGLFGDKAVAVFDLTTNTVLTTIPVTAPDGLVITPDGSKVFVSSTDSGTVKVISTVTDTVVASIDVGAKPAGITLTPDGSNAIVSVGGANEAVVVDVATYVVLRQAPVSLAHSSCVSGDGHYAYVGSQDPTTPAIVVVDITGVAPETTWSVDKAPRALAWTADKIYFSVTGSDALEVIDLAGKVGTSIPTGGSPHDTRPTVDGKYELVISQTAGDLELIDPQTDAVVGKVPTGKMPHWIGLSSDGKQAYVTNEGDNNLAVVDLGTLAVVATVPVGNGPRKIALER